GPLGRASLRLQHPGHAGHGGRADRGRPAAAARAGVSPAEPAGGGGGQYPARRGGGPGGGAVRRGGRRREGGTPAGAGGGRGARTFPHGDPRRYALVLLSNAFGGGMSSRLFQRVREELGLAYAVYSFQSFYTDAGQAGVYVGTRPEWADRAVEVIRAELARV